MAGREKRPGGSPERAIQIRDGLVVLLGLTSGAVDAVTFVRLGKVFSSVITGNLALLGVAAGQRDGSLAVSGGLALVGYGLGVIAGRVIVGTGADQRIWPRRTTVTLAAELVVLAGFSAGWLAASGSPTGGLRVVLVMVGAVAMGMQAAAVRRLGHMSSTYLTSTLTGMLEAFAIRRWPADWRRNTGVILAVVAGAVLGATAATTTESVVPVAVLVPLAVVVACAAGSALLRLSRSQDDGEGRPRQEH